MKIVVTAQGKNLNAPVSPTFTRCPVFICVDTVTNSALPIVNAVMREPKDAGMKAAQIVLEQGAEVVITNKIEPQAFHDLQAAGVAVFSVTPRSVGDALKEFLQGKLLKITVPTI
jgi:predicted Fe-Mo cluster-binding NifX family protein